MVKRSAKKVSRGSKRSASSLKVDEPVSKRSKAGNEPLPGGCDVSARPAPEKPVAAPAIVLDAIDSDFIADFSLDSKDIAKDSLPMPEDPLDKVARVLAAVGPDGNEDDEAIVNDLDIEDDLVSLAGDDVDAEQLLENVGKRWPLNESPEALTFSVLNAVHRSKSTTNSRSAADMTEGGDSTDDIVPDLELDDYIDYDSCSSDNESAQASPSSETSDHRAPVVDRYLPLYFYRERPETEIPFLDEVDFNAKDVLAAWSSVAPGIDPCAKASYIRNVVFAAASLNPSSMASGRARQTMAPPAPPTVDL